MSYAVFAESVGLVGITVERPEEMGPAWDRALGGFKGSSTCTVTGMSHPSRPRPSPDRSPTPSRPC